MWELAGGAGCPDTWLHEVRAVGIGGGREGEEWRGVCAVLKNWKTVCYLQWLKLPGEVQVALEQQGLGFGLSP